MTSNNDAIIVRSRNFEKKLQFHVDKNYGHQTCTPAKFKGTNLRQTNLKDVIIARLYDFDKMACFSSSRGYVDQILVAEWYW